MGKGDRTKMGSGLAVVNRTTAGGRVVEWRWRWRRQALARASVGEKSDTYTQVEMNDREVGRGCLTSTQNGKGNGPICLTLARPDAIHTRQVL